MTHPTQHSFAPLERQKSPTLAWKQQAIGRNGVQKANSQTKMTTEVNTISFSGLNNLIIYLNIREEKL